MLIPELLLNLEREIDAIELPSSEGLTREGRYVQCCAFQLFLFLFLNNLLHPLSPPSPCFCQDFLSPLPLLMYFLSSMM